MTERKATEWRRRAEAIIAATDPRPKLPVMLNKQGIVTVRRALEVYRAQATEYLEFKFIAEVQAALDAVDTDD